MELHTFLEELGIKEGEHLLLHSSIRRLRSAIPNFSAEDLINALQTIVGKDGSLIMPTFTYCFKKTQGEQEIFDPERSHSKVGMLTEVFRRCENVVRTASATHSFALWGAVREAIDRHNAPSSPLGEGSVMDWLAQQETGRIFMPGVDFQSLSFGHYLENIAPLPWIAFSPWEHLHVLPVGVSVFGEQPLRQAPGCSKPFANFEQYLRAHKHIEPFRKNGLSGYLLSVPQLLKEGLYYFRSYPDKLLCAPNTCEPCDNRRFYYLKQLKHD